MMNAIPVKLILTLLTVTTLAWSQQSETQSSSNLWPAGWEQIPARYVELFVVADHELFKTFFDKNESATIDFMVQHVKHLNTLTSQLNVHVVLAGFDVHTKGDPMAKGMTFSYRFVQMSEMYSSYKRLYTFDILYFITGHHYLNSVIPQVGGAYGGGFCSENPVMVTKYSRDEDEPYYTLEEFASIAAHQVGHLLGLELDDESCACPEDKCIMAPDSLLTSHWSSCSLDFALNSLSSPAKEPCFDSPPIRQSVVAICGNGLIENGEQCDCPYMGNECRRHCCDMKKCRLIGNSTCSSGSCCNNCQLKPSGAICRQSDNYCDVTEHCDGESEHCPVDRFRAAGSACDDQQESGYCYDKTCRTRDDQCRQMLGDRSQSCAQEYYGYNNDTSVGHCGQVITEEGQWASRACADKDVLCGALMCTMNMADPDMVSQVVALADKYESLLAVRGVRLDANDTAGCFTFDFHSSQGFGLVADGTSCGADRMCFSGECGDIRCLDDCNGHGNCVNGDCSCHQGFSGPSCTADHCPDQCSGRGQCDKHGRCRCFLDYGGHNCSLAALSPAQENARFIELFVVADHELFKTFFNESESATIDFIVEHVNHVNTLTGQLNVHIILTGFDIQTEVDSVAKGVNFEHQFTQLEPIYQKYMERYSFDAFYVITGHHYLNDTAVGFSFIGGICIGRSQMATIYPRGQDSNSYVAEQHAATAAHEVGHLLGMDHDEVGHLLGVDHDEVGCQCQESKCVMAPALPVSPYWSSCSRDLVLNGLSRPAKDRCLDSPPSRLSVVSICGNGLIEDGEQCDCSYLDDECRRDCCDMTTCRLIGRSKCSSGACCRKCQIQPAGDICRQREKQQKTCDLAESCDGRTEECPVDHFKPAGSVCSDHQESGYCYGKKCRTRNGQCRDMLGQGSKSCSHEYYSYNTQALFSQCGQTVNEKGELVYKACKNDDILCGALKCELSKQDENARSELEAFCTEYKVNVTYFSLVRNGRKQDTTSCYAFNFTESGHRLGLVADGSKCGQGRMCTGSECGDIRCLDDCNGQGDCVNGGCVCRSGYSGPSCIADHCPDKCSGRGQCDKHGRCKCFMDYVGHNCFSKVQEDPMPVDQRFLVTLVAFLLVAAVVVALIVIFRKQLCGQGSP
ncbi:Disintegrin and metalloproteinase domain-containing protein 28 [Halotydeus destructor]|nr:Disintegrin and metalloproteinase domain-containing protein 28 [Halotydeus destructor]